MTPLQLATTLALVGTTGIGLALLSQPIRRWLPISEPLVGLLLGILVGPAVLGWFVVADELRDVLLLEGSRVLLAASVMAAALRFPASSLRGLGRATAVLLVLVMPVAALLTGAAALAVGLPLGLALLAGACLAPTDPVLAASVVNGEPAEQTLTHRVRALLSVESGANDGLGIVMVAVLVAVVLPAGSAGSALGQVAWEVLGGTLLGLVCGVLAGWGLTVARAHHDLGHGPELVYSLLLAAGVLGLASLLQLADVLAVFMAGLAYNRWVPDIPRQHQEAVDEGVNRYAVLPLFLLLGATLPWAEWRGLGPGAVLLVAGAFLLRRLPAVLLLHRPLGLSRPQGMFTGWHGPMGVSALFYVAHARHEGVTDPALLAAVTLVVSCSVVVFGLGATPARRAYASRYGQEGEAEAEGGAETTRSGRE